MPKFGDYIDSDSHTDKRIENLEKIVERLSRRAKKKTTALITPYPISSAVFGEDIKGPILRYLFPCAGTITKGYVDIGKKLKSGASIKIEIKDSIGMHSKSYIVGRRNLLMEPQLKVDSGSKLTVSISHNEEELLTEVWISFLWIPSIREVEAKSYLISELENDLLQEEN